ncbi:MAG: glycogen synthase [Chloroflexota bacterium]
MNVLFLTAEAEPYIKVGGLGDVAGSLPPAIHQVSAGEVDIRLVIPFHAGLHRQSLPLRFLVSLTIQHYPQPFQAQVYQLDEAPIPTYFIAGPPFTTDAPVYSADSGIDGVKYTFFSLAALEFVKAINWQPDIIHANDWHTSPALYALYVHPDPFFTACGKILTVHNLPYLGHGAAEALGSFGLPPAVNSSLPVWAQHLPLPLGLLSADRIIAVSPSYAQEILTKDFSAGLDEYLQTRAHDIFGILNGIDQNSWNPAQDSVIPYRYDINRLSRKKKNKALLLQEFHLPAQDDIPLLGIISRMDYQKGIDVAFAALRQLNNLPWQMVILGTGNPVLEQTARQLQLEMPERVRALIRFDPHLSRKIYAAADILLIPSRYEPCGLAQMIAMRYGTLPLARATGGLKDTITDNNDPATSSGFLFENPSPEELAHALQRALAVYRQPRLWRRLQRNAMQQDFSWQRSARQYLTCYQTLTQETHSRLVSQRSAK